MRPTKTGHARAQGGIYSQVATQRPKLVAIIENDLEATLIFYDMDASTWQSLYATSIVERSIAR
jgi:transposase-like protein